jgi:stage II sporulation protein D
MNCLPDVPSSLRHLGKLFAFVLAMGASGAAGLSRAEEPVIRVQIIATLDRIVVTPIGSWKVVCATPGLLVNGREAAIECRGSRVHLFSDERAAEDTLLTLVALSDTGGLQVKNVPYGIGWWWGGQEDRRYEGEIRVRALPSGRLSVVVCLPIERYLCGVVPYEIGGAPFEALRAQAIAARSEAFAALRNRMYAGDGYDICGDVDCQVYGGTARTSPEVEKAIRTTSRLVLKSGGVPLNAYFASNCGGHSESVENVWPQRSGPRPYWSAHPDADSLVSESLRDERVLRTWLVKGAATFCNPLTNPALPDWSRKYWRWKVSTSPDSLAIGTAHGLRAGRIVRIDSVRRGSSGRILSAVFIGERGNFRVSSELEFRQVWSPPLRSSCVVVDREGPAEGPYRFLITGAGWGHGVGMCQSGAAGMALAGRTAEQILRHYYPTADLAPAY